MNQGSLLLIILLSMSVCATSEDKGHCPSPADIPKAGRAGRIPPKQTAPTADATIAGIVYLQIVVSDTGYICNVQLIRGFDKTADAKAMQAARTWRFTPSHLKKSGQPVAVEMRVEVAFRRNANGELVLAAPGNPAK
ncbi:MAG: TonB family protein [Candidatus Angelobacter sp.]